MKRATAIVARTPAPAAAPGPIKEQLKAERIQELLHDMPGWRLAFGGTAIMRRYALPGRNSITSFVEYVAGPPTRRAARLPAQPAPWGRHAPHRQPPRPRPQTMAELNLANAIDEKE